MRKGREHDVQERQERSWSQMEIQHTHTITVGIGFPQGGVCSAKFWIIAFNEAIEIINEYGITGQGFADDCGPMIGGDNTHEMYKSMQGMLNKLYHWGEGKNLKFNPTKTIQ